MALASTFSSIPRSPPPPSSPAISSTTTKPPPPSTQKKNNNKTNEKNNNNNRSLSDQLRPLTQTLLNDQSLLVHSQPNPKPIWVNPSRPLPPVLSPQRRQPRRRQDSSSLSPSLPSLARCLSSNSNSVINPDAVSSLSSADAFSLLNSLLRRPDSLLHLLSLLETHASFPLETSHYNVALKSLRISRQYNQAEMLMNQMISAGKPTPDNITYSTLITCAKRCRRFDEAIMWFDHMYKSGLTPDEVTYSAVLDVYARIGRREDVLALYDRGRAAGWKPDSVALSVLARMFGRSGDYDGIQFVLKEMKVLEMAPNLTVYNALLEALGNAGKPGLARNLFDELTSSGVAPDAKTLTAMVKIYGKARWGRDALELWERMRVNKWPGDFFLYNTLLSMCADLGWEADAEKMFEDMKHQDRYARPDSFSYTAMINIYASGGKADRAMALFDEMLENGVEPNVMGCTCLIQCLGKAKRIQDAVNVFETSMQRGVTPDDRLACCLLSLVALCEEQELNAVFACLRKANPLLVRFVELLSNDAVEFDEIKGAFREIMNGAAADVRRPFCNCLIDICRNRSFLPNRAQNLLQLGSFYDLYPGLQTKSTEEWSLNLRSLSVGAANTAFDDWMKTLSDSLENEESLPQLFLVHTGAGTHKFSQGLAGAFAKHLENLAAPFLQSEESGGSFFARKEDLIPWLESRAAAVSLTA